MKKALLLAILLVLLTTSVSAAITAPAEVQLGITNQARTVDIISSFPVTMGTATVGADDVVVSFVGVDAKYAMAISVDGSAYAASTAVQDYVAPATVETYTIKGTIPTNENSGKHTIGSIKIDHDGTSTLVPLVINPISKLKITDIDIKHGDKTDKNLVNGNTFDDVFVGDNLEITVEISNQFTNSEDTEFEDVEVEVTIVGIDDDEDLNEEVEISKIKESDEQDTTLTFKVPYEAEEDTYDIIIEVVGESDLGDHSDSATIKMEVEKAKHALTITELTVEPDLFSCNENANINLRVENFGEDEEDAKIMVTASEFDFTYVKQVELSDDVDDSDSKFSASIPVTIPKNSPAGEYDLVAVVYYDQTEIDDEATFKIQKTECKPPAPTVQVTQTQLPPANVAEYVIEEKGNFLSTNSSLLMGLVALTLFLAIILEAKFLIRRPISTAKKVKAR